MSSSFPWPTTITILLIILIYLSNISGVFTQVHSASSHSKFSESIPGSKDGVQGGDSDVVCRPYGICEPCPEDALNEPFCHPFGNRRLMHCSNRTMTTPPNSTTHFSHRIPHPHPHPLPPPHAGFDHPSPDFQNSDSSHSQGEIPAWESCGRIVAVERADFWEFVACNIVFALAALFLLVVRERRGRARRMGMLAARIGLARETGRR